MRFEIVENGALWDEFVLRHKEATFLNSWTWSQFEKTLGHQFLNYGVYDNDQLVGVLPISVLKAKRGAYLHLRHSPILDWSNEVVVKETMEFLRGLAKEHKALFVRMSPLLSLSEANNQLLKKHGLVPSLTHNFDAENTLKIDITKSEEELLMEMRKNTRYSIRQAQKQGVIVEIYDDLQHFDLFWEIFIDGVKRNHWVAFSKEYVKTELEVFLKQDQARLFISYLDGKAISAAIFIFFNGKVAYHHSGSLSEYRNVPSTYLLIWEVIRYAKSRDFKLCDLWGVSPADQPNHPWYGLSLFKRGFGGFQVDMVHAHDLIVSPLAHLTRYYEMYEKKRRGH
ncbi:MAG: peptidoglycan bridge formation glycyltransferase FemA/FemB family protein [Candidatus Dojkabacteria bacterium]|nr:MAG: peptidoglycan bridge formation glycyltransferase FemA/FemB family protein [Candidatus Dojkabacteria bacterium]